MARRNTVVGLDIGQYAVKAVWAERRGSGAVVTRMESLRLPTDRSDTAAIIGPSIERMALSRHPCVIGVPGSQSIFQPLVLPPEDRRTFDQATAMEVVRFNEMASETMVYGFAPIEINPGERRILLSMARPSVVDQIMAAAHGYGLDVVDIVPTPVAMFNALEPCVDEHPSPYLYVGIGYSSTEVVIGARSGLLFARAFAGGGQMFTDALAKAGSIASAQAENLKISDGSLKNESPTSATLTRVADLWIAEVQSCLSVFRNLFPDRRAQPTRMVFAGGGSELRALAEYAGAKIGLPAVCATSLPGNPNAPRAAHFAVAAGLAMAGLDTVTTRLSLLPQTLRDEQIFRRQKPFWIAAGITAVLILGASIAGGYRFSFRMEKHRSQQESSLAKRQQLGAEIDAIKASNDRILAMAKPVRNLLMAGPTLRDIITLIASSKAPTDAIVTVSDADSYFSGQWATAPAPQPRGMRDHRRAVAPPVSGTTTGGVQRVIIEGFTRTSNLASVKDLITKLLDSGLVESADLLSDDKLVPTPGMDDMPVQQRFVIDLQVKPQ